ncbi:MAG: hypothetical protein GY795_09575, partial [Desulfobacterales bacterium]|nr:hypothetical protein [Desulfobacterales bacterium]
TEGYFICSASSPAKTSKEIPGEMLSQEKMIHHSMTLVMQQDRNFPAWDGKSQVPKFMEQPIAIPKEVLPQYDTNIHGQRYVNFHRWLRKFMELFQKAEGGYLNKSQWASHLVNHLAEGAIRNLVVEYMQEEKNVGFEELLDFIHCALLDDTNYAIVRAQLPNITWRLESENLRYFKTQLKAVYRDSREHIRLQPVDNELIATSFLAAFPYGARREIIQHFGTENVALDDVEQLYPFAMRLVNRYKNVQHRENSRQERKADNNETGEISVIPNGSRRKNSGGIRSEERSAMQRNPSKKNQEEHSPR